MKGPGGCAIGPIRSVIVALIALAATAPPAWAELRIDITQGRAEPLPIAIAEFAGASAEDAQFGHPALRGMGTSRTGIILPLVIGMRKAKEMYYTGDSVGGIEAEKIGLINHAWPGDELERRATAYANRLANLSADHLALLKLNMNRFYENMGIYSSVRSSTDMDAFGQFTNHSYAWQDTIKQANETGGGLKEALAWRDGPYKKNAAME